MKSHDASHLKTGSRLTVTFAVLIALILGGNGLLLWQFQIARAQTERLTGVSQQVIAVLRLQEILLSFHERLDELTRSQDANRLATEAGPLRATLLEQIQRTRSALLHLPSEIRVDAAFPPTLEAIEIALPSQLEAITALAGTGDWDAVGRRLGNELKPLETQTSALVKSIDLEVTAELTKAVANMRTVQRVIFIIVPATAISTFFIATFFGWAITRRIVELRLEERVAERTRIARELHDTILQGFISASMQLHIATDLVAADSPARPLLGRILQLMRQVIEEGRVAVRGFRSIDRDNLDLQGAFSRIPEELDLKEEVNFRVIVEGHAQTLRPLIRDEVYAIGREALVNSFRHSGAGGIEVEVQYSTHQLRVLVSDDGCGIDPGILQGGREGHWGLPGMRERADRIGAKLKVMSRAGRGTEVELCIPKDVAFEAFTPSPASKWLSYLFRRK
jgi:signal transduction histidine kinase